MILPIGKFSWGNGTFFKKRVIYNRWGIRLTEALCIYSVQTEGGLGVEKNWLKLRTKADAQGTRVGGNGHVRTATYTHKFIHAKKVHTSFFYSSLPLFKLLKTLKLPSDLIKCLPEKMWKGYHLNVPHILKLEKHMSFRESMWLITSKQLAICNTKSFLQKSSILL